MVTMTRGYGISVPDYSRERSDTIPFIDAAGTCSQTGWSVRFRTLCAVANAGGRDTANFRYGFSVKEHKFPPRVHCGTEAAQQRDTCATVNRGRVHYVVR